MNGIMTLPRLAASIPRTLIPAPLAQANAAVSRFLIEAGAIREGDIPAAWDDTLQVCERALDAWVKRELGPLHCLSPCFAMVAIDECGGYPTARPGVPLRYSAIDLYWHEAREHEWPIGQGLEALDRECPGVGAVVLKVLSDQSRFVYPLFTPDLACDVATYAYWCGEEDEEIALDMQCGEDEQARAAMREEMVTRAMLEEAYPEWARRWPHADPRRGRGPSLRQAARKLKDPKAQQIAADALALSRLRVEDKFRPDIEGEYIGFGAVLSWHENDVTVRIYDDLLNMAHQAEFCDRIGELQIALDAPQDLAAWQKAMRTRFEAIGLIDHLIHRLSA
jgi:PRTRC genetic system protein F